MQRLPFPLVLVRVQGQQRGQETKARSEWTDEGDKGWTHCTSTEVQTWGKQARTKGAPAACGTTRRVAAEGVRAAPCLVPGTEGLPARRS